jgi:hypothetical protein
VQIKSGERSISAITIFSVTLFTYSSLMGWDGKLSNKRSQSEGYNPMLKKRNMSIREVGLRDIIPC